MSSNAQTQSKTFSKTKQNVVVVGNGMVGDHNGELFVASPLYK